MAIIEVKDNNPVGAIRELLRSMLSRELVDAILVPQETPSKKTVVQTLVRDPAKLDTANPLAPVFGINSARIITKMCVGQMPGVETAAAEPTEQKQNAENEEQTPGQGQQKEKPINEQEPDEVEQPTPVEAQSAAQHQCAVSEEQSHPAPIAVVLRPCEIRALVELVKLQQASIDPFVVVGVDCWGTYSVQDYAAKVDASSSQSSVTTDFLKQVTAEKLPDQLR
ncbi:MAG: hypothetical protein ACE5NM_09465, partial [Sedimentisphaerales bacterium]